jgi:sulfite oxidase
VIMSEKDEEKDFNLNRREFSKLIGSAGLGLWLAPNLMQSAFAAEGTNASKIIPGKIKNMYIHNAKLGVMETPLTELRKYYITPKQIAYSRMHFPISGDNKWDSTLQPPNFKEWDIQVSGLVERPRTLTLKQLKGMKQQKVTAVMQCAGNGRSYYAAKAKCPGGQWRHGGMANFEWEGVSLREVLDSLDLGPAQDAHWLTANGRDVPPTKKGVDFIKSYHFDDPALDHALLALKLNGELIPAIHGGPVRLIVPGYYGNMSVKSVSQLLMTAEQSPSPFQSQAYRVPDKLVQPGEMSVADFTTQNSKPTYAFQIMSVIFSPLEEDGPLKQGRHEITGVAFNDGTVPITEVAISTNGGKSWQSARIEQPPSPFAWYQWKTTITLDKGKHELMARATDAAGRSQPMDGTDLWNPKGYEWHGVDRVKVVVT